MLVVGLISPNHEENIKIFKKLRDKIDTLKHKKIINFF